MAKIKSTGSKFGKDEKMIKLNNYLKAVSDENRLRILYTLGKDTLNVSEIYERLKLAQNLTSHHISKLKEMDLLNEKRQGTFRYYSVNTKKLKEYQSLFKEVLGL